MKLLNESQCHKKRSYATKTDALTVARKQFMRRGVTLRVYQCPNCKWFHLTKTKGEAK